MNRSFRALGLALLAAFAVSAMAASGASATSEGQFTADSYPAHVTGFDTPDTVNAFTTAIGNVECDEASYTGEQASASSTITITPTYHQCGTRTVTMNGCNYIFHTTSHVAPHNWSGAVTVDCPPEKRIEVHAYSSSTHTTPVCTITIPEQGPLTGVTYTENTANGDLIVEGTVEGIEYQLHGACVFGTTPTRTDGSYHLNVTVQGSNNNNLSIVTNE